MSLNVDIKNFLYAWCGKNKKKPDYEFSQITNKIRTRFKCEVTRLFVNILLKIPKYINKFF
jgi:hypothetical protein